MDKPLLILDLDNTLVDRVAAVRSWARTAVFDLDVPLTLELVIQEDQDGFRPRPEFFAALGDAKVAERHYLAEYPRSFVLDDEIRQLLIDLRDHYAMAIVTNGPPFQESVIRNLGLDELVDTYLVSGIEDLRKPDAQLVELALARTETKKVAYVIGDSQADIELAANAHVPCVWIDRGIGINRGLHHPEYTRRSFAECRDLLLPKRGPAISAASAPSRRER